MGEDIQKRRGPAKKEGFRQELRITPIVEQVFNLIKQEFSLKNNSEALHNLANAYLNKLNKM